MSAFTHEAWAPSFQFDAQRLGPGYGDKLRVINLSGHVQIVIGVAPPEGGRGGWNRSIFLTREQASRLRAALGVLLKQPAEVPAAPTTAQAWINCSDFRLNGRSASGSVSAFAHGDGGGCAITVASTSRPGDWQHTMAAMTTQEARSFALGILAVTAGQP